MLSRPPPSYVQLLLLIDHLLLQRSLSQAPTSVTTGTGSGTETGLNTKPVSSVGSHSPPSGALGGDDEAGTNASTVGNAATDVAVLAPLQLKALECLEGLVFHNAELCHKVLAVLRTFEVIFVVVLLLIYYHH